MSAPLVSSSKRQPGRDERPTFNLEQELWQAGKVRVAGLDEVGRGRSRDLLLLRPAFSPLAQTSLIFSLTPSGSPRASERVSPSGFAFTPQRGHSALRRIVKSTGTALFARPRWRCTAP